MNKALQSNTMPFQESIDLSKLNQTTQPFQGFKNPITYAGKLYQIADPKISTLKQTFCWLHEDHVCKL